jgi:hypothetical protein
VDREARFNSRLVAELAGNDNIVVGCAVLERPDTVVLQLDEELGLLVRSRLVLVSVLGGEGGSELRVACGVSNVRMYAGEASIFLC